MSIFPASLVVIAVWFWLLTKTLDNSVLLIAALLPFGMFAMLNVGGSSLLAGDFVALASIGLFIVVGVIAAPERIRIPNAGLPLLLYSAYSAFAAIILVRLFSDSVLVFAFNRLNDGERISVHFSGGKLPLAPSSANISQSVYIFLAAGIFLLFCSIGRRRGVHFLLKGILVAGVSNLVLAFVDFLGFDALLSHIRTADYSLLNELSIAGIPRVIGGFSEAAPFGAFSAALGSFLFVYGVLASHKLALRLGVGNLLATIMSVSSTGMIGLAVFLLVAGAMLGARVFKRIPAQRLMVICLAVSILQCGLAIAFLVNVNSENTAVSEILDRLLFSKLNSVSGLERAAMAWNGIEVFAASWGLGAGPGSVMSSGYLTSVLGSVGIPGLLLLLWFYALAFFPAAPIRSKHEWAVRKSAQCFFYVSLATATVSSISPNPGSLVCIVAAVAVVNSSRTGGA